MSFSPSSNALALKRKLQQAEPAAKRHHLQGYDPQAPWLSETKSPNGWRTLGNRAVQNSLPLANMVSAVQDLIDPDFDPLTALLDEEPRFLKPLPDRICPEDLEFLRFRGALSIPEIGLRNELLRSYVQWVHSFMPVLNLQEFLRCVAENDPNGNVSVLLFQAVMFVGTAFIDLKHLQAAGYSTRKSARNAFFTRLRLLYSLECEEDRIVILQTLLLMTYWSDPENSPQRDIWDWIGVCNTQAHSIGLNTDPASIDLDIRTRRLRSRIWWCLYSRDRLIAMGMRRPLQVNEGTSNVPMLRMEDFDFEPFCSSAVALFRCRQLEDVSHQKRLATMFIEKAKLCQCIGRVLFAQYAPSQRQLGATDRTTVTLVPRQASESEFTRCTQKLDSWLSGLPKDAQFIPQSKDNFRDGEDVLLLHGAMLRMLFHATTSALHRPWAAASKDQSKSRVEMRNTARTKMQDAAAGITHIIQGLNQLNLTRFLPQSGVTVILPAAVAHLSNSMSDNPAIRESSISNFHRCIQVLHCLKDIYPAANIEFANLEAATKAQSANCSSNTFFQIMQYNFAPPTPPTNPNPRRPSADPIASPRPRAQSQSTIPNHEHQLHRKQSTHGSPSNSNPPRRSFPNDFDDHFAETTSPENPFNFFTIDFDTFPIMSNTTEPPLSPSHDLDGIDWTQALFRGNLPELDKDSPFERKNNTQQEQEQEQDLFAFALKDDDGMRSATAHHDITGDLDRDLGFQTGDEGF
ncbi:uncharacterized protein N7443_005473 [Penicillium atrosanguineum]|uniref:Xylanolytic transcriptional activator regulatory domain-containing protein n=1 Tax=Penicillium atrosanguineum TaxID=1132637 RepID=A0A9W9PV76_9EURO|nr:uncharacterized protein N7443_005473 [Penicillium atrosanguineum]KAJ5300471.1 hypothetical protein N7443_005473 [Penicillium atrosanguineum]KAJ5311114.1 hypothetical protein N7476_006974 [Penicillium atrosanguineum]